MSSQFDLFSGSDFHDGQTDILYLDTETTGIDLETAEVCEIALLLTRYEGMSRVGGADSTFEALVRTLEPIPPEASAIHHITNSMIRESPLLDTLTESISQLVSGAAILCGHNLSYDLAILSRQLPSIFGSIPAERQLDSLRLSRHVWPSIPSHALQVLRYRFGLDERISGEAHRALFDTELVRELVEFAVSTQLTDVPDWNHLVEYTRKPLDIKIFGFGKYRGKLVEDIAAQDADYIRWLLRQNWMPDEYPDLYHTLLRRTKDKEPEK